MLPIQAFVTGIKTFDRQKLNCLILPFQGPWALDFQRVKGQIAAVCSWSLILAALDRPPKGALIAWFPVANTSTCKTKVPVRRDSPCFCRLLWQSVASFPLSRCILTWFIASLLVELGNELGCKPNSGHVPCGHVRIICWLFAVSRAETATSILKVG